MKLLLISGSLRQGSFNTAIINHIANSCGKNDSIKPCVYDGLAEIPPFSPDLDRHTLDNDDSPEAVKIFRAAIKDADALIISTPEYAFEIPGCLKNALDWLISSGELVDKPTTVISASTSYEGGSSANAVLTKLLGILSAKVMGDKPLCIDRVNKKIDENGKIIDKELADKLVASLDFLYGQPKNHLVTAHLQ